MTIPELPSNSRRPVDSPAAASAKEPPKLDPVEGIGKIVMRKKPFGRRILDTFFRGDSGVLSYLVREVIVPAAQTMLTDMVTQGIERAVYGESRTPPRGRFRGSSTYPVTRGPHVGYDRIGQQNTTIIRGSQMNTAATPRRPIQQTASIDLGEILLETEFGAQTIVETLYDTIEEYGGVTVANLKELLGETAVYTDHKWGWRTGAEFQIRRARGGFSLDYPDPIDLR